MGVKNWRNVVTWRKGEVTQITPPRIAIDVPNYLIRRLSTIKKDYNRERVPLSYVTVMLGLIKAALRKHILPVFVFDGPPELLKRQPNPNLIADATNLYQKFKSLENPYNPNLALSLHENPALRMYFAIEHLRDLSRVIGVPGITAPSEAEMMAAVLCKDGLVGTVVSNDADVLLFGSPHVVRSLQLMKGEMEYSTLNDVKQSTGLDLNQLRDLAVVCGCDFCKRGVKGIGPRKGAELLRRHGGLAQLLKAKGYLPSERSEFIKAREVFDESDYLATDSIDLQLKAQTPRLRCMLEIVFGEEKAERYVAEIHNFWKKFWEKQVTLEQWVEL